MNLQLQRIQQACESLKLDTMATEWSAVADRSAGQDQTLADFLEQLLQLELDTQQPLAKSWWVSEITTESRDTRRLKRRVLSKSFIVPGSK